MNSNLWRATQYPDRSIENTLRAGRVWDYLVTHGMSALYKDIRADMGLTYWQTVKAVGLLAKDGFVTVLTDAIWNGQHWIYPHTVKIVE